METEAACSSLVAPSFLICRGSQRICIATQLYFAPPKLEPPLPKLKAGLDSPSLAPAALVAAGAPPKEKEDNPVATPKGNCGALPPGEPVSGFAAAPDPKPKPEPEVPPAAAGAAAPPPAPKLNFAPPPPEEEPAFALPSPNTAPLRSRLKPPEGFGADGFISPHAGHFIASFELRHMHEGHSHSPSFFWNIEDRSFVVSTAPPASSASSSS
mmetsp:Transcript_40251/g.125896  ORF Transcript_40251/g.125896 Transcript_40251/m.125896 type:complete len:212 (-) Transcript_40251:851-1486(-)